MAKLRVHELAKELNINSKEVLDTLKGTDYEVKTSNNSIDDKAQGIVRMKFVKNDEANVKKSNQSVHTKTAMEKAEAERPKKKASISAVFNPQNSKQGGNRRPSNYHSGPDNHAQQNVKPVEKSVQEAKIWIR